MTESNPSHTDKLSNAPKASRTKATRRILVVEDDGDLRELSVEVLVCLGYEVEFAADGEHAWRAINTVHYDLMIANHKPPGVSGIELLKKLREARISIPVILASANPPGSVAPQLQPAATLLMPYTITEYLGKVKEILPSNGGSSPRLHG